MPEDSDLAKNNRKASGITSFSVIFSYLYCMMSSNILTGVPISGGTLFLLGRLVTLLVRFGGRTSWKLLSPLIRLSIAFLMAALFLAALLLAIMYPAQQAVSISQTLLLAGIVLISTLREIITRRLLHTCRVRRYTKMRAIVRVFELDLTIFFPFFILLLITQPYASVFYILGGYVLSSLLEYGTLKNENTIEQNEIAEKSDDIDRLNQAYAYQVFQNVTIFAVIALQVTLMIVFAMIGYSAKDLFYRMATAAACIYLTHKVTVRQISGYSQDNTEPGVVMISGISLWFAGLLFLSRNIVVLNHLESYLSLVLCSCGVTATMTVLYYLEYEMRSVAAFSMGHPPTSAYDFKRQILLEFANLAGQMLALLGLALLFFYTEGSFPVSLDTLHKIIRPMLLLPSLLLVFLTLLTAMKFPMTSSYMKKLRRFLRLKYSGGTNIPLQQQLEDVIIKINHRHYGMKLLLAFVRPFYYHRIRGKENVVIEDGSCAIFICNHGELYGPVVANLYIPYSFRPWSISELTDPKELADYIYQFTFIRQRWIIPCLKRPLVRAFTPVILWAIRSIESIAVYRDKPRELIQTFRVTIAAMEAGDNILIFPENPRSRTQNKPGYLKEGIGEFYSGFTMLGPMYYERTGKRLQFIPIYADKKRRILTFGRPTFFDPDAQPVPEKERIVKHLRDEIVTMAIQSHAKSNNGVNA